MSIQSTEDKEQLIPENSEKIKKSDGINPYKPYIAKNCEIIFACYSDHKPLNDVDIADESIRHKFVEVHFKGGRKDLFRNELGIRTKCTENVIVEVEGGIDFGSICNCGMLQPKDYTEIENKELPKYKILRIADDEDKAKHNSSQTDELNIVIKARELVKKHHHDMKITDAEWQFDKQRLTIYFTAPQRIDFRELVKDLARIFKTRIELRQISTREETKRLGNGVGCCGLVLCCNSFLNEFSHVTLDHARMQQLSNNVTKLSGNCGRLKCCLLFEYQQYKVELDKYPPIGSQIILKDTNARITKIDAFKDLVFMQRADTHKIIYSNLKEINEYANKGMIIYAERSDEDKYEEFLEGIEIPPED